MRRERSSKEQFRVRIPADVLDAARGQSLVLTFGGAKLVKRIGPKAVEIGFSLRTSEPSEVKLRQAEALRQVETFFAGLRQRRAPVALTLEQCVRLAGDFYRGWTAGGPDSGLRGLEPDALAGAWQRIEQQLGEALDRGPEQTVQGLRKMAESFLLGRGLAADEPSLEMFCDEIVKAIRDAAKTNARKAAGDFSESGDLAKRFGEPLSNTLANGRAGGHRNGPLQQAGLSLRGLLQSWRDDPQRKPAPATHAAYTAAVQRFVAFLGHEDARRVTQADVLEFRRHRLGKVSPKTVRDGDLAGLKSIFSWAVQEGLLPGPNPVAGVKVVLPSREETRAEGRGFSDDEAAAILRLALRSTRHSTEKAKTVAAKRWVPWLMAYSGARVGEFAQLRKQDVRQHRSGFWYARLTPDAGTIKDRKVRDVPLHSHLIEMGFLDFVNAAPEGHLFLDPAPPDKRLTGSLRTDDERGVRGPLQGITNRLREFSRLVVVDPQVPPSHGWRHRVKAVAFSVGVQERVIDEIQGQSSGTVSRSYGKITLETKREAVERLPRYDVAG